MTEAHERFGRYMALIPVVVVALVAVPIGLVKGAPAVVLWIGFSMFSGAVLLFWETLRLVLDPSRSGDAAEGEDDGAALGALEERKRAAVQALRDLEFERSIGRLGEDDHRALEARYREEARAAMRAIDEGIGPWRTRAEAMLAEAEAAELGAKTDAAKTDAAKTETKASAAPAAEAGCPKCQTLNDEDAVFCKRCGHRLKAEVADATT
ncbi:MAG: zinc ribbon domain-containing protein [Myxococcaceae bacterium]|nr:MAG: zinc ribbon domain-containing protein [Myxococcaceae bacterium]